MNVTTLNIKGNELTIKDSSLTSTVDEIVSAMATNNSIVADRINNLDSRAFDYNLKIINNDESVIDNIRDGLYSIKYFSVVGEGDDAVETLTDSAILIQTGTNQYRYKDGQLSSRTKTNDTWGNWMTFEGAVTSVNSMTGAVQLKAKDVKALPDYSREYLTTVARENGTISFIISSGINTDLLTSMSYSTDGGNTWITTNNTDNKAEDIQIDVNVSEGDEVMWKGIGLALGDDVNNVSSFITNIPIDVEGNIMSLLYGDNFVGQTSLSDVGSNFVGLFGKYTNSGADVFNAENLILGATTLAWGCYYRMFYGCTSLIQAPALPAMTLADLCYEFMFYDCISLTQAPELPATTLAWRCYRSMFNGCATLTHAPQLPTTILIMDCYRDMFYGCTSLTKAPELPATTLASDCYRDMFNGCTALTQAPALPATTLASNCYYEMFRDCTSLTQSPELPANTLVEYCYYAMFMGCTLLTQAPMLPASTLAIGCYQYMFSGCTNLSSITYLATNISASYSTGNWLYGVAATGTFIKAESMTSWTNGASGIPNGWTVVNYIATNPIRYLTFKAGSNNSSFGLKTIATGHKVYYSRDLQYWKRFNTSEDVTINNGEEVYVIGDSDGVIFASSNKTTFRMIGSIGVTGDITSILDYTTLNEKIARNCYRLMFFNCTALTQAPTLPATTLANSCYASMFQGCTSLIKAPELPATTLADYCYYQMFNGCISLTQAPALPATILTINCYDGMFWGCTALTQAPALPATRLTNSCYRNMFIGCTALTQAPELPATTLANYCYQFMFYDCTSLTQAPTLPATTLAGACYEYMFYGCKKLSSVICLATGIYAANPTDNWLSGVAATGTFITADNTLAWSRDDSGIPSGWNVYTESEYEVVRRYELNGITHTFYKNIVDNTISDKIKIWIDDFSDISIEEMYDNYLNENAKHKQYHLTQGTITIDDITYYIWEGTHDDTQYDYDAHRAYILTTTNDYDELLSQSLSEDLNNNFTSFGGFLDEDSEESYMYENNNIQYILNVEQDNDDLYIYIDNIQIKGFDDGETISDYVNDPEGSGCNPYELTSDTIEIDGESYYIWERNDDVDDGQYDNIRYLLTTTIDRATLESTSVETSSSNLIVKQNNCIYGLMSVDNEIYDVDEADKNVIVKVE